MSYQFNFASSEKLIHQVTLEELDAVRKVMLKASFELFEIKHIEDQHVSETWRQAGSDKQICLEIIEEAKVEEIEEQFDQKVIPSWYAHANRASPSYPCAF